MKFIYKPTGIWLIGLAALLGLNVAAVQGAADADSDLAAQSHMSNVDDGSSSEAIAKLTTSGRAHLERCYDYANESRFEC